MSIEVRNIVKAYGDHVIYNDFSIILPDTGVVTLFGPSGCGKTTLLRLLAGLEKPDSGEIHGLSGKKVSVVFQEDRLLPWATIEKNLSLASEGSNCNDRVKELLELTGISGTEDNYPGELSGGMCRRVAIARALMYDGEVYLLDEPFKGLDQAIKQKIMEHFRRLAKKRLLLLITHDLEETEFLSDMIIRL